MKKEDKIYKITKKLYDKIGSSAIYDYAIDNNLDYLFCTACEAETPTFENDKICLICWTLQTDDEKILNNLESYKRYMEDH